MKIETPILRRLGPVPFWRGEQKCLDELERIYRRAAAHARGASAAANAPERLKRHKADQSTIPGSMRSP